jgi:hypothetical protein
MKGCIKPISVPNALKLFTDASGNIGYAAVFGSWWFANYWTKSLHCHQIAVKELFPIVIALELWGKYMVNSNLISQNKTGW